MDAPNIITSDSKSKITKDVNEVLDAIKVAGFNAGQEVVRTIIKRNYGTLNLNPTQQKEVKILLGFIQRKIQEHYSSDHLNHMAGGKSVSGAPTQTINLKPYRN